VTPPPPASVIVVSRGRPRHLARCLTGLGQSDHPAFEVVVVADPAGCAAVARHPLGAAIKLVGFERANIAAARNAGIVQAAGAVVAFLDDDAVPEPTWLARLVAPFADPAVSSAGGFVRGRNGISFQWRARTIAPDTSEAPLAVPGDGPSLHPPPPGGAAIKTEGTCCAFRRTVLAELGGFDPAYAFYLDEADLNLRLAAAGALTAIVPGAQVHHGFAASPRRTEARVPRDLAAIGASSAVFVRRHGAEAGPALARLRAEQRARLLRHMVAGGLVPGDVGRLMATLEAGIARGLAAPLPALAPLPGPAAPFRPLPGTGTRPGLVLCGRSWQRTALHARARAAVAAGAVVTVLRLGPGARAHRMGFRDAGFWEQTGGRFGRSDRDGPRFVASPLAARFAHEIARLSPLRPVGASAASGAHYP